MSVRVDAGPQLSASLKGALAMLLICGISAPALAQAQDQNQVDLQLALMVDASGSVNQVASNAEARLCGGAAQSARAAAPFWAGASQSIALTMVQWTGPFLQVPVLPWTLLKDEASVISARR